MRLKGGLIIIGLVITLLAKSQETYDFTFDNVRGDSALLAIQSQSGVKIYFLSQWVDSIRVSGQFTAVDIESFVKDQFKGAKINVLKWNEEIILTQNAPIVTQPAISKQPQPLNSQIIQDAVVFPKEFMAVDQSKIENKLMEIGDRSKMQFGKRSTIAGFIREKETGEPVVGALVYAEDPLISTSTDYRGFYSLALPNGQIKLHIQYTGLLATYRTLLLYSDGQLNVDMLPDIISLDEVLVTSDRDANVSSPQMGMDKIDIEAVKNVPIVLGESDVVKIATTMAGVQTVGEGASGFNVRGGKVDQNLVLLEGAPVYNTSHFFGFFSVFNSDAVAGANLFKSGIPAKYGGRLSSIFDVKLRDPSTTKFSGRGGISPVTSRLLLEIPIIKEKSGLMLAGRSTYSDWALNTVNNISFRNNQVSFYDVLMKYNHELSNKTVVTATGYVSRDKFNLTNDTIFAYTNANASIILDHSFNSRWYGKLSTFWSRYEYEISNINSEINGFKIDFGLDEFNLKADVDFFYNDRHQFNGGAGIKRYGTSPGTLTPLSNASIIIPEEVNQEQAFEGFIYLSDKIVINDKLTVEAGIRLNAYGAIGTGTVYEYPLDAPKDPDQAVDSTLYTSGELIKAYFRPDYRLSGRYSLNEWSSLKFSISRTSQFIHMLSNSTSMSPTDIWQLSNYHIKPETADQVSLGYYRNLPSSSLELSAEVYYKELQNIVDFKIGSELLLNEKIETEVLQGDGKAYGLELSAKRSLGDLNGWANYVYARTLLRMESDYLEETINNGNLFPASYDKPHNFNLVLNYKFTRRYSLSFNGVYSTGRPITYPVAKYDFGGVQNIHYSERNEFRIPDYFRIDLGLNIEGSHRIKKLAHSFWSISVYNLTGRDNVYSIFFEVNDGQVNGYKMLVFSNPIPTITYNFKF
ncbi:MAG: carboxypeptidase-like regulatory domain-containing protein [Cyclobacteriaceae bacterium]